MSWSPQQLKLLRGLACASKEALLGLDRILGVPGIGTDNAVKHDLVARLLTHLHRNLRALPLMWPPCGPSRQGDTSNAEAHKQISRLNHLGGASKKALVALATTLGVASFDANECRPKIIAEVQAHLRKHISVLPLTWPTPVAWTLPLQELEMPGLVPVPLMKPPVGPAELNTFLHMHVDSKGEPVPLSPGARMLADIFGSSCDTTNLTGEPPVQESAETLSERTGGEQKRCRRV